MVKINLLSYQPTNDWLLIFSYSFTLESNWKVTRMKDGNNHKKFLIVQQILLVNTIGNVKRMVRRIWIMSGYKAVIENYCNVEYVLCTSLKIWNIQFPLQDIVTESSSFDLVSFIPLLRDRIYTANPFAKQFLVSWVSAMHPSTAYKEIHTSYWMV